MNLERFVFVGYGLLLFFGAYFGWKAGSQISLVMGVISGILVLIGVFILNSHLKAGYLLLTVVSGLLSLVFLMRLLKTHAFMPGGFLLLVSAAIFALSLNKLIQNQ